MNVDVVIHKYQLIPRKKGNWKQIKKQSGVYIFSNENEVLYVGQSMNLCKRMHTHYGDGGICNFLDWKKVEFIFCDNPLQLESAVIKKLNPIFNNSSITTQSHYKSIPKDLPKCKIRITRHKVNSTIPYCII